MAWHGTETRCTLQVDLVRYHPHLVPGAQGTLIPNVKTTKWGTDNRFGAVRFDCCGHTLDIVLDNLVLDVDVARTNPQPAPSKAEQTDILAILWDIEDD